MFLQWFFERGGQYGDSIFIAFPITHNNLAVAEIDIFDSKSQAFHQSETSAIQKTGHEPFGAFQVGQGRRPAPPRE